MKFSKTEHKILWQKSISTKIKLWLFLILLSLLTISYYSMNNLIRYLLDNKSTELSVKSGNLIVSKIEENLLSASGLAQSLASLANSLPHDEKLYMSLIPDIINIKGKEHFIAGGGIWHEPFQFDSQRERRSFFWGRNNQNSFDYFDDYNDPKGKGYHHEEWYVPAKYIGDISFYWSQSYTDPFSSQPMVTVTKPFYKGDSFKGVSTVDIKLNGLKHLLDAEAKTLGGKAFLLDRKGRFISFPEQIDKNLSSRKSSLIANNTSGKSQTESKKRVSSLEELAGKEAEFNTYLTIFNQIQLNENKEHLEKNKQLAKVLSTESYQIDEKDAKLIAQFINAEDDKSNAFISSIQLKKDPLFNRASKLFVFKLANTHWTLGLVIPKDILLQTVLQATYELILYQLIAISIIIISIFYILHMLLTKPLLNIITQIQESIDRETYQPIVHDKKDELGVLSSWFNKQSRLLKQSEEQMRSLFDLLPDSVIIFDCVNFNVIDFNTEAHHVLGYTRQEFEKLNYRDLLKDNNEVRVTEYINLLKMSSSGTFEEVNKGKNGNLLERSVTYKIIDISSKKEETNKIALTVFHDLSDIKAAENMRLEKEAAEIANTSKSIFLANMSHELRTPMHGILSYASMGLKRIDKLTPEKTEKYFSSIKMSADRLMRHLNDLLDLAKLEAGKMDMEFEGAQIKDILDICLHEQAARMQELEIGYKIEQLDKDIVCELDSHRIGQVITNFLSNAIKFSPKKTDIEFKISSAQLENIHGQFTIPALSFSTRDYGKGIPDKELELVFDKFTQSSDTVPGTTKGTGLGLPICKEIIDAHGGKIWAKNSSDSGAIFTFIIPLAQDENGL